MRPGFVVPLLVALWPASLAHGETASPTWLREAAAARLTPEQAAAPAVVLRDERTIVVSEDGTVTTHHRYAARIASREGRRAGRLSEVYFTDSGRVRQARGWIIRPSGEVQEIDKKSVADVALAANDIYVEARAQIVDGGEPEPGMVFGAEIVSESAPVFAQFEWALQNRWPVKQVLRRLALPAGWRATSTTFNHAPIEPTAVGSPYTWELADLPAVDEEPAGPPLTSLVPRLAVSYFPSHPTPWLNSFASWNDVSRWLAAISDGQAAADAALKAKALELTAHAASEFERVRAIGAYVQRVGYISIQMGLGRGGGFRPRPASQVLARNQGDCKDKANLMRALLAAVGIRSYLVSVFAGDRDYVRDPWPSPQQFNHCILAVVLAERPAAAAAVLDSPTYGRLLFVDATDEHTAVGTLPRSEEGSLALVVAPDGGALVRLPTADPDAHGMERVVDAMLNADGSFVAAVRETRRGQAASSERATAGHLGAREYQARLEKVVIEEIPAARISELANREADDGFESSMRVAATGYGQLMQGRLLVFRPPFSLGRALPTLSKPTRTQPVLLESGRWSNSLHVAVPAGFELDELPEAVSLDTAFGRYTLSARQDSDRIIVQRQLVMAQKPVPVADYAALRKFVDAVRAADTSPVAFRRR